LLQGFEIATVKIEMKEKHVNLFKEKLRQYKEEVVSRIEKREKKYSLSIGGTNKDTVKKVIANVRCWSRVLNGQSQKINLNPAQIQAVSKLDFSNLENEYSVALIREGSVLHLQALDKENISAIERLIRGTLDNTMISQTISLPDAKFYFMKRHDISSSINKNVTISFLGDKRKVVLQGSAADVAEAQKSVEDILKMTDIELPSGLFSLAKPIISDVEKKNNVIIREETNKGDSKDSNRRSRRRRRRGSDKGPKDSDKKTERFERFWETKASNLWNG